MKKTEDENIEKYGKQFTFCMQNTYHMNKSGNVFHLDIMLRNRRKELTKFQRRQLNFIYRSEYAENLIICIGFDADRLCNGDNTDKLTECLTTVNIGIQKRKKNS